MRKKSIAILGSTGSIGTQTLAVIKEHPDLFKAEVLTAANNYSLLIEQAKQFQPKAVVIGNTEFYSLVKETLADEDIQVYAGTEALSEVVQIPSVDVVLTALVGFSGLLPTVQAIKAQKTIALANKETLVVAGALITELAKQNGVDILPVDSEHSAIFQCLVGEEPSSIEKLILTASGGPFRGKDREYLRTVSFKDALKHPNWTMGQKITIDSASLMNKGLEVIEAYWLFGVDVCQIDVVVHPQSIVHSMVQFKDGSIKAQLGLPDMMLPIQYALAYPQRVENSLPRMDFNTFSQLSFEQPDTATFSNLRLAYEALNKGGSMPCVLNAANEVVVAAFLKQQIDFLQMSELIEETMLKIDFEKNPDLETFSEIDHQSRVYALEAIQKQK
ncbi:1-deoxy-D-xylulose-5-phosphate reductoisomerase [Albibacterium profundi]|uniref:1-deoxy-D-xylulose 5-phosphate reductoisomerase n=1 Tax=Albibacterium profundi TaxID=3134906 RepID=A0ABV5CEU1_9SPHI